jgi:hypothetical protein
MNLLRGFPGLLFDPQFGLIPNAPVYGFVLVGVLAAALKLRRWGWEAIVLTVPYMTAVGTYQMWWGGTSVPARLLAPITLVLGVAAPECGKTFRRAGRRPGITDARRQRGHHIHTARTRSRTAAAQLSRRDFALARMGE